MTRRYPELLLVLAVALAVCVPLADSDGAVSEVTSGDGTITQYSLRIDLYASASGEDPVANETLDGMFSEGRLGRTFIDVVTTNVQTYELYVSVTEEGGTRSTYGIGIGGTVSEVVSGNGAALVSSDPLAADGPVEVSVDRISSGPPSKFTVEFSAVSDGMSTAVTSSGNVAGTGGAPVTDLQPDDGFELKLHDGDPNTYTFSGLGEADFDRIAFTVHGREFGLQFARLQNVSPDAEVTVGWFDGIHRTASAAVSGPGFYSIGTDGSLTRSDSLVYGGDPDRTYTVEVMLIEKADLRIHLKPDSGTIAPDLTPDRKDAVVFLDTVGTMTVSTDFLYPVRNGVTVDPWIDGTSEPDPGFSLSVTAEAADGSSRPFPDHTVEYLEGSMRLDCTVSSSSLSPGEVIRARILYSGEFSAEYGVMDVYGASLPLADIGGFADRPGPVRSGVETGTFGDAFTVILGREPADVSGLSVSGASGHRVFSVDGMNYLTVLWPSALEGDTVSVSDRDGKTVHIARAFTPDLRIYDLSAVQNTVTDMGGMASVPVDICLKADGGLTVASCTAEGIPGTSAETYGGRGATYMHVTSVTDAQPGDRLRISVNGAAVAEAWYMGRADITAAETEGTASVSTLLMPVTSDGTLKVRVDRTSELSGVTLDRGLPFEVVESPDSVYVVVDTGLFSEKSLKLTVSFRGNGSVVLDLYRADMTLLRDSPDDQMMDADRSAGSIAVIAFDRYDDITEVKVVKTGTRKPVGTVSAMGDGNAFAVVMFDGSSENAARMTLRIFAGGTSTDHVIILGDEQVDLYVDTEIPVFSAGTNIAEDRYRDGKLVLEFHEQLKTGKNNSPVLTYGGNPLEYEMYTVAEAGGDRDVISLQLPGGFASGDSITMECTKKGERNPVSGEIKVFVPDVEADRGPGFTAAEVLAETGGTVTVKSYTAMSCTSFLPGYPVTSQEVESGGASPSQREVHYGIVEVSGDTVAVTDSADGEVLCRISAAGTPTWTLDLSKSLSGTFMAETSASPAGFTVRFDSPHAEIASVDGFSGPGVSLTGHDGRHVYADISVPAGNTVTVSVSGTVNGSAVRAEIRFFTPAWVVPAGTDEMTVPLEDPSPYQSGKSYIKFEQVSVLEKTSVTNASAGTPFAFGGSSYLPFLLPSGMNAGNNSVFGVTADGTPARFSVLDTGKPTLTYSGTPVEGEAVNYSGGEMTVTVKLVGKEHTVPTVEGGTLLGSAAYAGDLYLVCGIASGTLTVSDGTGLLATLRVVGVMRMTMTEKTSEDFVAESVPPGYKVMVVVQALPAEGTSPTCAEAESIDIDTAAGRVSFVFGSFGFQTSVMTVPAEGGDVTARLHMLTPDIIVGYDRTDIPMTDGAAVKVLRFPGKLVPSEGEVSEHIRTKDFTYVTVTGLDTLGFAPRTVSYTDGSSAISVNLHQFHGATVDPNNNQVLPYSDDVRLVFTQTAGPGTVLTASVVNNKNQQENICFVYGDRVYLKFTLVDPKASAGKYPVDIKIKEQGVQTPLVDIRVKVSKPVQQAASYAVPYSRVDKQAVLSAFRWHRT